MWALRMRAYLASAVVFALFFSLFYVALYLLAPSSAYAPLFFVADNPSFGWLSAMVVATMGLSGLVVFAQFWFSPRIIEWSCKVQYVDAGEMPELQRVVQELAKDSGIPTPRVGVSDIPEANAFAFGRWLKDGRICVTRQLLNVLPPDELRSVLGHEISHLRHKDMAFMTVLQVVPLIAYTIARALLQSRARGKGAAYVLMVGAFAFLIYLISTLLVLYVSRLREAYADQGSVELTGQKAPLASALYRLTKDTARLDPTQVKELGGTRSLLITDPYRAQKDADAFEWTQVAPNDTFSEASLQQFDRDVKHLGWHLRLAELLSTHPVLEHRLKLLAELPSTGEPFVLSQAGLRSSAAYRKDS